ncbi:hypothetical protein Afil01_10610 [Actinorhabdospora filicis]|uniref:DUF4350 domain-containing protein n=1 Tax=Actinorhabdospora filicis TaxID=1785913 RepID=A0A9W6SIQ7_9ACTN|nr:DUF4350 domain-containing protein [Actinorhabdospora filicis]GLZ76254.1 hypothetical protein Afil01_10610 [Actinorhabdospora filicis]
MSAETVETPVEATEEAAPQKIARRKRPRRFVRWRLWTPFAVVAVLLVLAVIAVQSSTPDPADTDYASPTATGEFGASALAERLHARGVQVDVAKTVDQLGALTQAGPVTVFVPAEEMLRPDQEDVLAGLPPGSRVVMLRPPSGRLTYLQNLIVDESRSAAGTADPGCGIPEAQAAGVAEVRRDVYRPYKPDQGEAAIYCYGRSMVVQREGDVETVVVGAADPFLNGRIDHAGNSALAVGLLSQKPRMVWLDMHRREPHPPMPEFSGETHEQTYDPPPAADWSNPLYSALPPSFWAVLVGVLVTLLALAFARGRRIGPPAVEPLAVRVPAAETVYGRARLYRRAGARDTAFQALRDGAIGRMLPAVGLTSKAEPARVVATIAAKIGAPPDDVHGVLYGAPPQTDQDLLNAIYSLDTLEAAVHGGRRTERHTK